MQPERHFDESQKADFINKFKLNARNLEAFNNERKENMMKQFYHDFRVQLEARKEKLEKTLMANLSQVKTNKSTGLETVKEST